MAISFVRSSFILSRSLCSSCSNLSRKVKISSSLSISKGMEDEMAASDSCSHSICTVSYKCMSALELIDVYLQ